jgi:hypothetical protein
MLPTRGARRLSRPARSAREHRHRPPASSLRERVSRWPLRTRRGEGPGDGAVEPAAHVGLARGRVPVVREQGPALFEDRRRARRPAPSCRARDADRCARPRGSAHRADGRRSRCSSAKSPWLSASRSARVAYTTVTRALQTAVPQIDWTVRAVPATWSERGIRRCRRGASRAMRSGAEIAGRGTELAVNASSVVSLQRTPVSDSCRSWPCPSGPAGTQFTGRPRARARRRGTA